MESVTLAMTAGLPYHRRVRVMNGKALWPTLDSFEVRSQIREGKTEATALLGVLTPYLTKSFDGVDIVVDIDLTGEQTREIPISGSYDIVISDPGPEDARAFPILAGKIKVKALVTAATDE